MENDAERGICSHGPMRSQGSSEAAGLCYEEAATSTWLMSKIQKFAVEAAIGIAWGLLMVLFPQMPMLLVVCITTAVLVLLVYAFRDLPRTTSWRTWAPQASAIFVLVGFILWINKQPGETTAIGYALAICASILVAVLTLLIAQSLLSQTGAEAQYAQAKIETLRSRATSLRDILLGINVSDADERLRSFREIGEDFVYEEPFKTLLPKIEHNATRMRGMAALPPVGPQSPDPEAHTKCMQEGHAAVDELMRITAKWVNRENGGGRLADVSPIKKEHKQAYLNRIADLRYRLAELRIDMEKPEATETAPETWEQRFHALEDEIAQNIEAFATPAEAAIYRTRGNIVRRFGPQFPLHQLYVDLCIHDLDYLRDFVKAYSRREA